MRTPVSRPSAFVSARKASATATAGPMARPTQADATGSRSWVPASITLVSIDRRRGWPVGAAEAQHVGGYDRAGVRHVLCRRAGGSGRMRGRRDRDDARVGRGRPRGRIRRSLASDAGLASRHRVCACRGILYATTGDFLHYFGLADLEDLPPLEDAGEPLAPNATSGDLTAQTTEAAETAS